MRVTVNTDDPTVFNCTLSSEMRVLVEHLGATRAELAQLQINAFEAALLPESQQQAIISEIKSLISP